MTVEQAFKKARKYFRNAHATDITTPEMIYEVAGLYMMEELIRVISSQADHSKPLTPGE